jgi:hypothetical protein
MATALSVAALFAERDALRHRDKQAEEQLHRQREEELVEFRKRLDNFKLTDEIIQSGPDRIKRAFERGETELMFSSVPQQLSHRQRPGDHQRRGAADQQAEQGRGGKPGRTTRLAVDPTLGGASGL